MKKKWEKFKAKEERETQLVPACQVRGEIEGMYQKVTNVIEKVCKNESECRDIFAVPPNERNFYVHEEVQVISEDGEKLVLLWDFHVAQKGTIAPNRRRYLYVHKVCVISMGNRRGFFALAVVPD